MHVEEPRFAPLLTGYGIKAPQSAFEAACSGAASGEYGAADVVYARNTSRVELALVLEPEVAYRTALQIDPQFGLAHLNLGAVLGEDQLDEAIEAFENFIRYAPPKYAGHVEKVKAFIRQHRG